ncbi:ABC-type antimicrobial peptide transport system, permease component [Desulfomonile tiedjei DSM 6799]|uniref:ABC-type antimicrobial peptide transport system, permease component n=2 Tax=Desulfomonile tiedjei TaxID=2358 RepID=I4C314_DESTA|nr:ABC-type antimicrobial peptide transport system, permease component [Desulfomonile tiedjei DSM 6799]
MRERIGTSPECSPERNLVDLFDQFPMISPFDGLQIAVGALRVNLMRSLLTMLGIVIGVAAVIVMVAVGAGAREMIGEQIRSIGSNLILVVPGASVSGGARLGSGSVHTLKSSDADAIVKELSAVRYAAPVWGEVTQVVYGNRNWRTRVTGTTKDYFPVREWKIDYGRLFSQEEEARAAKVAVLGKTVVENLMGTDTYPLGKVVRIKNVPFTVVGVLEKKGQSPRGDDQDDAIFVPLRTAQYRLFGTPFPDEVTAILVQAKEIAFIPDAEKQIDELLTRRHKIGRNQEKDFTVRNLTEILDTAKKSLNIMTTLLGAIAAISLLVGGIGIMNIMLVSVTERTREIGIRMAVGARSGDILSQFLVEAVVLSMAGGFIGIMLGVGGAFVFAKTTGWPALISAPAITVALVFSGAVGVFFGFYPAYKASRLHPIDALRYE